MAEGMRHLLPHPTLKSISALLSLNNLFLSRKMKRGCLSDWPLAVDGGWSSELESLQNDSPATAVVFYCCQIKGFEKGQGSGRHEQYFPVFLSENMAASTCLDSSLSCWLPLSLGCPSHHSKVKQESLHHLAWETTTGNTLDLFEK